MTSYLIDEILDLTKDHKSRPFFEKALRELGEHVLAEEFGELKHQMRTGQVHNLAKYLTTLLKKRLNQIKGKEKQNPAAPSVVYLTLLYIWRSLT